jgi:hypothetical protein
MAVISVRILVSRRLSGIVMVRIIFILLLGFTLPVMAESDLPPDLVPIPEYDDLPPLPEHEDFPSLEDAPPLEEAPPLPHYIEMDPELEPKITIIKSGGDTIEEYRLNGELYMIKVTPRVGFPYYLRKNRGYGMDRHPGDAGNVIAVPTWQIIEW